VIKLEPKPPREEEWWWSRRLGGHGGAVHEDSFEVQLDARRADLEEAVRRFQATVVAANRDYPTRYSLEAEAEARARHEERLAVEAQLREDQAVVDRVLREPSPDGPP
jgi:hypothetical protein